MPPKTNGGKNEGGDREFRGSGFRGSGHPNKLLIRDYAIPGGLGLLFRAETEIHITEKNKEKFSRLVDLLGKAPTKANNAAIVEILHEEVDRLRTEPEEAQKAKDMFAAAFGVLKVRAEPAHA